MTCSSLDTFTILLLWEDFVLGFLTCWGKTKPPWKTKLRCESVTSGLTINYSSQNITMVRDN